MGGCVCYTGVFLHQRTYLRHTRCRLCTYVYMYISVYMHVVGTDKSNDFDHFAKEDSVRSEITYLGNFGPNRILFGKVVEVVRLIRSHTQGDLEDKPRPN